MYALVEIKGKQYKAVEGETLQVDLLNMEEGASYETDKVLAVVDGENAKFGTPYVAGAKVVATVAKFGTPYVAGAKVVATVGSEVKGEKVKVYKFHRRKGYRRTQGHREQYTMITINKINA